MTANNEIISAGHSCIWISSVKNIDGGGHQPQRAVVKNNESTENSHHFSACLNTRKDVEKMALTQKHLYR